jgi:hypothetical protein
MLAYGHNYDFQVERKSRNLCQARGERSERASEDDNKFLHV